MERAPREEVQVECKGVKLQPWRQNGNCDLREGLGLGRREVYGDWESGSERADPMHFVSSPDFVKSRKTAY